MTVDARDGYRRKGFDSSLALVGPFALLMVDFCNAFVDEEFLGGGNIKVAAARSLTLLEEARRRGWPIAHSQIVFDARQVQTNVWIEKVPALGVLTEENSLASFTTELAPLLGEKVIRKAVPSAFLDSDLKDWLSERHVRSIVIAGCTTSGCVRASAIDAISYGFRPIIAADCVGDRLLAAHDASLADLHAKYAEVLDQKSILLAI